jgi:hypothetical protein
VANKLCSHLKELQFYLDHVVNPSCYTTDIQFLSSGCPGPLSCYQATGDFCAVKCPEARQSDCDYSHAEAFPTQTSYTLRQKSERVTCCTAAMLIPSLPRQTKGKPFRGSYQQCGWQPIMLSRYSVPAAGLLVKRGTEVHMANINICNTPVTIT